MSSELKAFEKWFVEYGADNHQYDIAKASYLAGWKASNKAHNIDVTRRTSGVDDDCPFGGICTHKCKIHV